jgi:hypothetical protein
MGPTLRGLSRVERFESSSVVISSLVLTVLTSAPCQRGKTDRTGSAVSDDWQDLFVVVVVVVVVAVTNGKRAEFKRLGAQSTQEDG